MATTSAIQDNVAAEFAKAFYAELTARSLRDAFDTAVQTIRVSRGDHPRAGWRQLHTPIGDNYISPSVSGRRLRLVNVGRVVVDAPVLVRVGGR